MSNVEEKKIKTKKLKKHEISSTVLRTLIDGYVRLIIQTATNNEKATNYSKEINNLLAMYYPKQLYMIILNQTTLKLTLCDTSRKNTKISSNHIIHLHSDEKKDIDFGADIEVGFCHKQRIEITNLSKQITNKIEITNKCNAIFKVGGRYTNKCGMILYNITDGDLLNCNNLYYYQLPSIPFDKIEKNNPVYSDKYGLILFGYGSDDNGKIARLRIDNEIDEIKWNIETLPKALTFNYAFPPDYCLINDKELFIINGYVYPETNYDDSDSVDDERPYNEQTSIYNLDNGKYSILKKNPYAGYCSGMFYSNCRNEIFIGGGTGTEYDTTKVHSYNLHKNKYIDDLPRTKHCYSSATLWCDESGTTLNIACPNKLNGVIYYESIDLRAPAKWIINKNVNQLAKQLWKKIVIENNLSIVTWI